MNTANIRDSIYTLKEVAQMLGVTGRTITKHAKEGKFPPPITIPGYRTCWSKDVVDSWLEKVVANGILQHAEPALYDIPVGGGVEMLKDG